MKKFLFLPLILLIGCGYKKWADPIDSFSTAAPTQLTSVSDSYTEINSVHNLQQEAILANSYAKSGYHPGQVKEFISDDDLKSRAEALSELKQYTVILNDLVSGKSLNAISASNPKATTTSSSAKTTVGAVVTKQEMDSVISGLNSIVTFALQQKTKKEVPAVMIKADPYIQQFAILFEKDLNDFKSQAANDYSSILISQNQFIQTNQLNMDAVEKRNEIEKLVQLESDSAKTQRDFDLALNNIRKFAKIHHQLTIQVKK